MMTNNKYKWHYLRKNPYDLSPFNTLVIIQFGPSRRDYMFAKLVDGDKWGNDWSKGEYVSWVINGNHHIDREFAMKWKYIEPVEEEEND